MITVYHAIPTDDDIRVIFNLRRKQDAIEHWNRGGYRKVAEVPGDDLDIAWRKTNSVNESWYERDDITVFLGDAEGLRSSMVGDIFVLNETANLVSIIGFDELDLKVPQT